MDPNKPPDPPDDDDILNYTPLPPNTETIRDCESAPEPAAFFTVLGESHVKDSFVKPLEGNWMEVERKKKRRHRHSSSASSAPVSDTDSTKTVSKKKIHKSKKHVRAAKNTTDSNGTEKNVNSSGISVTNTATSRQTYEENDRGPYLIHVQKNEVNPSNGTSLHPIHFGRFINKNSFKGVLDGEVKSVGRNRVAVSFNSASNANNFLSHPTIASSNFKAFIPTFNITRQGIVRGIPIEWTEEEILEDVKVLEGYKVIKARRLNYKKNVDGNKVWSPSQTVVLTFDGQFLPKRVTLMYNSLPVELYKFPTVQCYKCCRFGHTKLLCRSTERCYKCAEDHSGDSCRVDEASALCISCKGNHFAINHSCTEFARQDDSTNNFKKLIKSLYDFTKFEEIDNGEMAQRGEALPELIVDEFDPEQIWQEIELQNSAHWDHFIESVSSSISNQNNLLFPVEKKVAANDSDIVDDEESSLKSNTETKINNHIKRIKRVDRISKKKGKSSAVDDDFFKLNEMERYLELEDKREMLQVKQHTNHDDDDSLDLFEDDSEQSEGENEENDKSIKYDDFFDGPNDDNARNGQATFKDRSDAEDESMGSGSIEDLAVPTGPKKGVRFNLDDSESDDNSNDSQQMLETKSDSHTKLSEHQLRQQRLHQKIEKLEEKNLAEKPWQLQGEVDATKRPQNSLLEEIVDFDLTTRPVPIITEETTLKLEDIIRQRVKDRAWDDVERKAKPVPELHEFRKTLVLDQEKSKASLAQVYEQEYLKQQQAVGGADATEEEPEEHKQIKKAMENLFSKLDALSNYHYTPKPAQPEVKIVSNIPAISMEEVAPVATSDAALLAPEEVKVKCKGDLMSKSERTDTDKKRERRKKKKHQREKEKLKKEKLLNKVKPGSGNKHSTDKTAKMIDKVAKDFTHIDKMTQLTDGKALKSSKAFFTQLNEDMGSSIKAKSKKTKTLLPAKKYKL